MDVCIRTFSDSMGATLARMQLQDAGIRSWIVEQVGGVDPALNLALGVRLMVAEADAARAEEVLSARAEEAEQDEPADPTTVRCPRCEMEYCRFGKPRFVAANPMILGIAFFAWVVAQIAGSRRWRCDTCGYVWDDPKEGPARRTALPEGAAKPTFRLRRGRAGTGVFLGVMVGGLLGLLAGGLGVALALVGAAAGGAIGSIFQSDVCSTPDCREPLPQGLKKCPKCRGAVSGSVRSTEEHFAASARVRRELARAAELDRAEGVRASAGRSEGKAGAEKRPRKARSAQRISGQEE